MEPDVRTLATVANLLSMARRRTHAQAGTVYRRDEDGLRFVVAQNDQLAQALGHVASADLLTRSPLGWGERSIASYVALTRATVNIADVYDIPADKPYSFNTRLDRATGFRTISMLALPLLTPITGVLQLINATDEQGRIIAFSPEAEQSISALLADLATVDV